MAKKPSEHKAGKKGLKTNYSATGSKIETDLRALQTSVG